METVHSLENLSHALERTFQVIIFDWDGTAVPDRKTPVPQLVYMMQGLLEQKVVCVVITGTSFSTIDQQCARYLTPFAKQNLIVCTNRGSEVYRFSKVGQSYLSYRRTASEKEEMALSQATQTAQAQLQKEGVETETVFNRLNRRKIDLIPLPQWNDPPKAEFPRLLTAVENRLKPSGGFANALNIVENSAREAGLPDAKITSDAKYIEIGLTDKADSIHWIKKHFLEPEGIAPRDVALFGDEFGRIGFMQGSDSKMRVSELKDSVYASVGLEPLGVPSGIIHLKGGPDRFLEFLRNQLELRGFLSTDIWESKIPTADPTWLLEQEGFEASREREMETLFSIGNGYMGIRGSLDSPIPSSMADLYISGIYAEKAKSLPYSELEFLTPESRNVPYAEIVPFPFPFRMTIRINGQVLSYGDASIQEQKRILDLKKGILFFSFIYEDSSGRKTSVQSRRCASWADHHLLLQEIEIVSEDSLCEVEVDTSLDTPDFNLNYPHLLCSPTKEGTKDAQLHCFETKPPSFQACFAFRTEQNRQKSDQKSLKMKVFESEPSVIRRMISIFTSRETIDPTLSAESHSRSQRWEKFDSAFEKHTLCWNDFWKKGDIELKGNPALTQAQRFNIYQLRIPADHDPTVSVGSRGLTGRAYEGHIFWDVEIFLMPFFLYTEPSVAQCLLRYRYQTLNGARARAKAMGMKGACYAWESTVTGEDVTPRHILLKGSNLNIPIFTGTQQIHVTADIAYAIWRYWDATLEKEFLIHYGAEILIETARFWESRCVYQNNEFHIFDVVGPDEYHSSVNDNAFTNWMARFNLEKAVWVVQWMEKYAPDSWTVLKAHLKFEDRETSAWNQVAQNLYFPALKNGVIEQFSGFFQLKDLPLKDQERMRAPLFRLLHWEEINQSKVIKQADVLMIPFLFPNAFPPEVVAANYWYYEPITDHGSSLSPCVHSAIAAQVGAWKDTWTYWEKSIHFDLMNLMKNTALGIHSACLGGTWQALIFHILGIQLKENQVILPYDIESRLPPQSVEVILKLIQRSQEHDVSIHRSSDLPPGRRRK